MYLLKIAVNKYWMYKFRNTSIDLNATISVNEESQNGTEANAGPELTDLQIQWASYLSIASMIPNVLFLLLNAIIGHKFRAQPRLLTAMIVIIALFIFSDVMTKVNTDNWQYEFLGLTLFTVFIINVMVAILQVRSIDIKLKVNTILNVLLRREVSLDWLESFPLLTWEQWCKARP